MEKTTKAKSLAEFYKQKGVDDPTQLDAAKSAEFLMEFQDGLAAQITEMQNRQATKQEMQELVREMQESQNELAREFRKANTQNQEAIKELLRSNRQKNKLPSQTSIRQELEAKAQNLKALAEGDRSATFSLKTDLSLGSVTKAPDDMTFGNSITGEIPQTLRLPGVNEVQRRQPRLLDLVSFGAIESNAVSWAYEVDGEGAPAFITEGTSKPLMDLDFNVGSESVVKIAAVTRVTDEMLEDILWMERVIRQVMANKLLLNVESGVYNGNGINPNLHGIRPVAPSFAAGSFAGSVDNANIVDVLNVALNQIMLAFQPIPTAILMHPSDLTSLKLAKVDATDRRYVDALYEIATQGSLSGIPLIPTQLITQGEYLLGYFPYAEVLQKGGIQIDIGYNGNDFRENFRTIRAEWRGVSFVEHNFRPAFVKGVFATNQAALETT